MSGKHAPNTDTGRIGLAAKADGIAATAPRAATEGLARCSGHGEANAVAPRSLRALRDDDLALFRALYADADTMRHIAAPLDAEAVARLFARARGLPGIGYRVVESASGVALGLGAVFGRGPVRELGLMLRPEHAGQGHARPALRQLMALAAADGVQVLRATHAREHRAAAWLAAACGFRHAQTVAGRREWRCTLA